jgi:LacI family transcriptional regulator
MGSYEFGYEATQRLLSLPASKRPTGIVTLNDFMAIGAMSAIEELGLQVGEDVAVTGFDDMPTVSYLTPPLTTVRQPSWQVGQMVIDMLLEELDETKENKNQQRVLLPPELIIRQSSVPTKSRMPSPTGD